MDVGIHLKRIIDLVQSAVCNVICLTCVLFASCRHGWQCTSFFSIPSARGSISLT